MSLNNLNPTDRFSDRVKDYVKFRPSYPIALLDYLDQLIGLRGKLVADVGSGTGIFSKLLLDRGALVEAVEPNKPMAQVAEMEFEKEPNFHLNNGTAEATTLDPQSIDFITCAQAFHWFEPIKTRIEFHRILKPQGKIALIWNDVDQSKEFGAAYEKFKWNFSDQSLQSIRDVETALSKTLTEFFKQFEEKYFTNEQELSEEGLIGRYFSSSYAPKADSPRREEATSGLRQLFAQYQKGGVIRLPYITELFLGR